MIRESAIRSAIPIYLRGKETAEEIIAIFNGDLTKTIQFLRERHFEDVEVVEKKPVPKEKSAKKTKSKDNTQEKLF